MRLLSKCCFPLNWPPDRLLGNLLLPIRTSLVGVADLYPSDSFAANRAVGVHLVRVSGFKNRRRTVKNRLLNLISIVAMSMLSLQLAA